MEGLAVEPVHIDQVRKPEVAPVKEIERNEKKDQPLFDEV